MKKLLIALCVSGILSGIVLVPAFTAYAQGITKVPVTQGPVQKINDYFSTQTMTYSDGTMVDRAIINGPPVPPPGYEFERATVALPEPDPAIGINTLTVPAFKWVFGCSSVSGAMIAGYYDRTGFPNMYTGPTNGGLMPLTEDSSWGTWTDSEPHTYPNNPLIASHNGLDGRSTKGSIDDYWISYSYDGIVLPDPYITGVWTQHAWGDAIGDYMKTSQSDHGNFDGSTTFYWYTTSATPLTCSDMVSHGLADDDGTYGRKLFYEARGYTVTDCYAQATDNQVSGGFSFAQYKAEIDADRPVLLNLKGHSIVGVGYDDSSNTVYLHDTWDNDVHTMTWGGSYLPPPDSMILLGVSIVNLQGSIEATPEGALGSEVTISGSGLGSKKGKVLIGDLAQKVDTWTPASVMITFAKYKDLLTDTPYDVSIQPKEPKGAPPIVLPGAFTMKKPELDSASYEGTSEQPVTITGRWFGTKKGQVHVNQQKCKVTAWSMDPATGVSTLTFIVHKKLGTGTWGVEVVNKIGIGAASLTVN
jgi:hypothetical protein